MAKVKLLVKGIKNPSPLYLRFTNGRAFDVYSKTEIQVNPEHWDNLTGNYKNLKSIKDRSMWNARFDKLKVHMIEKHNESYVFGEIIDKYWVADKIKEFFNRPKHEVGVKIDTHFIYYVDFCEWWLANKAAKWRTGKNKFLDERAIMQYRSFLAIWKKFSEDNNYKLVEIDSMLISKFVDFAQDDEGYSSSTIKRWVGRLRFFLLRAQTFGVKTALDFQEKVYVGKTDDIMKPYLSVDEIEKIFNLDLSHDDSLDNIRDSFIIGVWSALRISDFNRKLQLDNIDEDYINIQTTKTGSWVVVPLHPQVKSVLNKRAGNLPVKYSDKHFNEGIKVICMLAGIDEVIKGKKFDGNKKRSVIGKYKKYELVSSHICRRSFTTNLYGKISDDILADLGGWSDLSMMRHYVKRTKKQSAEVLKEYWEKNY